MNARLIQIMRMLARGPKDQDQIAEALGLSPITARRHIQRLREKGYWIELDDSGRYFILGRLRSGEKGVVNVDYGKRMEDLDEEMEKAAYKYILEGAVSGMMAKRDAKGEMVWRFTPADVAEILGVDEDVAERILSRLQSAKYLRCFKSGEESVYPPSEAWGIFYAFRRGVADYTEEEFSRLVSKQQFTLPNGAGLSVAAAREEDLPEGGTSFEIYSNTGLNLIQDLTEGFLGLALDAQGLDFRSAMPEIPDDELEEIEPESNMLSRLLTEFRPLNPWPWLWLLDLREEMPKEEIEAGRALYWSRAIRFLLILLRPIYGPLKELGVEGCVKMTEERIAGMPPEAGDGRTGRTRILEKGLEAMGPRRFWELSRALCLELLGSCLSICRKLGIKDEGTERAGAIVAILKDQQKTRRKRG